MKAIFLPLTNSHLERSMRYRLWSCVFWGVAVLSVLQQVALWLGLHVLAPGAVFLLAVPPYVVLRGLAAAGVRRWQEGQAQRFIDEITGRSGGE